MLFLPFPLFLLPPSPVPPVYTEASAAPAVVSQPARDILLLPDGNLWIYGGDIFHVGGLDAIVQECKTALELFRGEYILDESAGVPWADIFGVGVSDAQVIAAVRAQLLTVPGVSSVDNVTASRDTLTRTIAIAADVTTTDGAQLTVSATPGVAV